MADKIECTTHGDSEKAFVCVHLLGDSVGLGFNRSEPDDDNPFPDAWCDDCEIIRSAHGGWAEESEKLTKISLLCAGCYERTRLRNTRTSYTLDDLADLRWKCGSCEEWHQGPCLDFSYDAPDYWLDKHEKTNRTAGLLPASVRRRRKTFLDEDYCAIENENFFVRGIIAVPIIGTAETFRWGVWGSLSRKNFETLVKMDGNAKRTELPSMFSWLSSQIPEYSDTLSLKMQAHIREDDQRPMFELDESKHPLAEEYHHGVTPERLKDIMLGRLRQNSED